MTQAKKTTTLPYYGWFVLGASAVSEMLATGATSYAAGFFVLPLQAEFGLSRANASMPVLLIYLGSIFIAPYAGKILDRYPMRWNVAAGAFLFSAALTLISITSSLWLIVLLLLLPAAAGFMLFGSLTTATLASRWFYRRRGLAQGIAALALSGGGLIVAPLIGKAIQAYGWRHALDLEAAVIFIAVTALALLVLKDNPAAAGLAEHPENKGRSIAAATSRATLPEFSGWRGVLGNAAFWGPSLIVAMATGVGETIVVAVPPYGHALGMTTAALGLVISSFAIATALTKILAGVLTDYWDTRILLFLSALCLPLSLATLAWVPTASGLVLASAFAGAASGGIIPTSASLIAARFGAAHFGSVMGWTYALVGAATILSVRFSATVFDLTGGYHPAFVSLMGFSLAIIALTLGIEKHLSARPPA